MCPRAPAGATRRPEAFSRPDPLAEAHAPAGEMGVEARVAVAVPGLDHVPVPLETARPADLDDDTGVSGRYRARAQAADVDPRMAASERSRDRSLRRPRRPVG